MFLPGMVAILYFGQEIELLVSHLNNYSVTDTEETANARATEKNIIWKIQ